MTLLKMNIETSPIYIILHHFESNLTIDQLSQKNTTEMKITKPYETYDSSV